jgi:ligand-binding SRPBCC domain-containing protein
MKVLQSVQRLPIDIEAAWDFFSSPRNLKTITPPFMGFDITSDFIDEKMYAGMIITYKVSPLFNIPLNWVTEITHVREPWFFVDDQRKGPFRIWHHRHFFREIPQGIEMTDIVYYDVGLWLPGRMVENLIVQKRVEGIFNFRFLKLEEMFGKI